MNDDLNFVNDASDWTREQYGKKALDLTIYADTVLIDADVKFSNLKSFKIKARKLMVGQRKNVKEVFLSFDVKARVKSKWSHHTAPGPDLGEDGNHGENGADGFDATQVEIEVGCLTGKDSKYRI